MTINLLNFGRDVQGYNAYAPQDSSVKYSANLVTGVPSNILIPSSYQVWVIAFSAQPGVDIWVSLSGGTATVPAGGTLQPTNSILNPGQRTVYAGNTVSLITSTATAEVGIELWPVSYA
jgi:hypothetical protein